ncbi:class II fructose-bisphosphate aldolase [Clostridium sp. JN-1]|uniref:class II fructose-bisphosphate aldolase n=1 Tax=Clostridium sp. JN-1 TaxID=2483110 RepID=UPI001681A174|nr:class II fructose-bisphosphate aldolase [Clostridium sp. JN-1]
MSLEKLENLLANAEKEKYAVGAFSIANMEMIIGAVKAAEELNAPIILQIAEARLKHSPLKLIGPVMIAAAKDAKVPVAVHLDHGLTMDCIKEALNLGFTSVMIDGSKHSLEDNIKLTKDVITEAKKYGASVEAEIGRVGGSEDGSEDISALYTNTEDAKRFYKETGVNALAIGIGNAHGVYKGSPNLNFDVLKDVDKNADVPLVLHGGSGISDDDFRKCVTLGMRKINIATATFMSVANNVKMLCDKSKTVDYFKLHEAEIEGAYLNVKRHIKIFGTENKA